MGIVTTYTCDKCQKEQTGTGQLWEVGIVVRSYDRRFGEYGDGVRHKQLWCRACVVSRLGALPQAVNDPPPPAPKPTLEDMIREIIHEEISNA